MTRTLTLQPLTAEAFAPFGEVLDITGQPDKIINQGLCGRYHDRANVDVVDGKVGISLFNAELRTFPIKLDMMERHPLGSQAFIPMSLDPFLVIVAPDADGKPGTPQAFKTAPGQGVNYAKGTWHSVLTPIAGAGLFAVVDRIGEGTNLEEHWFEEEYVVGA